MGIQSNAGATISICASLPASHNAAGFNALTWSVIAEITNLPEFGRVYELIRHKPVGTRATRKLKGSYDEGQLPLELASDTDDPGQILLKSASGSDNTYSFRIVMGNGDKYFFLGMVMSFVAGGGDVDTVFAAKSTVELTSNSAGLGLVEDLAP